MFGWGRKKQKSNDEAPKEQSSAAPLPVREEPRVAKVLVLYYSSYGHVETMARAIAVRCPGLARSFAQNRGGARRHVNDRYRT